MTGTAAARVEGRGEARRRAILDAALRILGRDGPAGLTHRRVAREASVPLAATTYYFESKDALLEEALKLFAGEEAARLRAQAAAIAEAGLLTPSDLASALAAVLSEQLRSEGHETVAKFQVYLEASRRPELRAAAEHWIASFARLAESALAQAGARDAPTAARLLVAGVDGLMLQQLATRGPAPEVERLTEHLEALISALLSV
ncbi:MAG: TetR family transcriptional regulator [Thermoleophilaceae bacterium]